jgi:hypothetical protein
MCTLPCIIMVLHPFEGFCKMKPCSLSRKHSLLVGDLHRAPLMALHLIHQRHEAACKQQQQHDATATATAAPTNSSNISSTGAWSATLYADPAKRSPLAEMPYLFVRGLRMLLQAGEQVSSRQSDCIVAPKSAQPFEKCNILHNPPCQ